MTIIVRSAINKANNFLSHVPHFVPPLKHCGAGRHRVWVGQGSGASETVFGLLVPLAGLKVGGAAGGRVVLSDL